MVFDLLIPPQGPRGQGKKSLAVHPFYASNSRTKFVWISTSGLGDSLMDRRFHKKIRVGYFLSNKSKNIQF